MLFLLLFLLQAEDPVDRLIRELESRSAVRREIALAALRVYGGTAGVKLEVAKADPAVIDAVRGVTPEMRTVRRRLNTMKIDLTFENKPAEEVLDFIRDFVGVNLRLDPLDFGPGRPLHRKIVTTKAADTRVDEVLPALLSGIDKRLHYEVLDGLLIFVTTRSEASAPRRPVRIMPPPKDLQSLVDALGSDGLEERSRADVELRRIGFGAEPALWKALDLPGEASARAADLLRALYGAAPSLAPDTAEARFRRTRVTVDMQNAPLPAVLDYLREVTGFNFFCDPAAILQPERPAVTLRLDDFPLDGLLGLLLEPLDLVGELVEGQIYVTARGRVSRSRPGPTWAAPDTAARLELLISDMGSDDEGRREVAGRALLEIGSPALGPLLEASRNLKEPVAGRCRDVRRSIAKDKGIWLPDEPSGADLQTLTPAQAAVLQKSLGLRMRDCLLQDLLKDFSIPAEFKAAKDLKVTIDANEIPVGSLLRLALRPRGFDFTVEGGTVVIDTAENVRKRSEK